MGAGGGREQGRGRRSAGAEGSQLGGDGGRRVSVGSGPNKRGTSITTSAADLERAWFCKEVLTDPVSGWSTQLTV